MEQEVTTALSERMNGPFSLRLLLQPCMAFLFALKDGRTDAAENSVPYLEALFSSQVQRRDRLASAWASVGKILVMAILLDLAFQFATRGSVSILQAVGIASLLCAVPYTLVRGPAARWFGKS